MSRKRTSQESSEQKARTALNRLKTPKPRKFQTFEQKAKKIALKKKLRAMKKVI